MSAVYAWLRRHPLLVDSVLAAALLLFSIAQLVQGPRAEIPATLLLAVPVAFRRRAPIAAFTIATFGGAIQVMTGRPNVADVAVLVLLYTVAAYRPRRASVMALLVCLAGSTVAVLEWGPTLASGAGPGGVSSVSMQLVLRLVFSALVFGGLELAVWILGDSMRYRRGYYAALEEKAARLEAERSAQAKIAAAAERARIARELHDVVAHHVSVMVVQADGAGYALRTDPDRAEAALQAIAGTGRHALTEMRRLLGVLRSADDQATLAPVPGLSELRELLDQARAAGLEVSYTLTGTPRELPEGPELAAYRVVQESLTNTRKHAGLAATAAVTLRYEPDGLTVEVIDDGLGGSGEDTGGHGLAGMRERIAMYGGSVTAGPLPGGGFGVTARLPCQGTALTDPELPDPELPDTELPDTERPDLRLAETVRPDTGSTDPRLPATVLPDTVLTDTVLTDTVLPDTVLPDIGPTDAVLTDTVLPDTGPTDAVLTDTVLPDTGPTDTVLTDTVLPDTGPTDTVPTDTVPTDTLPTDTLPTDAGAAALTGGTR